MCLSHKNLLTADLKQHARVQRTVQIDINHLGNTTIIISVPYSIIAGVGRVMSAAVTCGLTICYLLSTRWSKNWEIKTHGKYDLQKLTWNSSEKGVLFKTFGIHKYCYSLGAGKAQSWKLWLFTAGWITDPMWVEFFVSSCLCAQDFSTGCSVFLSLQTVTLLIPLWPGYGWR